jgi:ankyrin repeat protein
MPPPAVDASASGWPAAGDDAHAAWAASLRAALAAADDRGLDAAVLAGFHAQYDVRGTLLDAVAALVAGAAPSVATADGLAADGLSAFARELAAGARVTAQLLNRAVQSPARAALALAFGAQLGAVAENGATPLHLAAEALDADTVRLLLAAGADPAAVDRWERTPLLCAVARGLAGAAAAFASSPGSAAPVDTSGLRCDTPLGVAARLNDAACVTVLLDAGTDAAGAARQAALPPLCGAPNKRCVDAVAAILGHPAGAATVTAADARGRTPLHWAALGGHADIARRLLDAGAVVGAVDLRRATPLLLAAEGCHAAVAAVLLADAGGRASVDTADHGGTTPLYAAATRGAAVLVRALLDSGADAARESVGCATPLHAAALGGSPDVMAALLSTARGASTVNAPAGLDLHFTPLHMTLHTSSAVKCVRVLLAAGADAAAIAGDGSTPLHCAIRSFDAEAALLLLETPAGAATVTVADRSGETPLLAAASCGMAALIRPLLDAGADLAAVTAQGHTVLHRFTYGVQYLADDDAADDEWADLAGLVARRTPNATLLATDSDGVTALEEALGVHAYAVAAAILAAMLASGVAR